MAIIIGDIHGDIEKARAFLGYEPQKQHIALGDLVDNVKKGITFKDEFACLDLLLNSNAILIWGNHDLAYTPESPWDCMSNHSLSLAEVEQYANQSDYLKGRFKENGNIFVRDVFTDRFLPHRDRMKAAYAVDGWLCTHAGVSPGIADIIPAEVISAGSTAISVWLNEEFHREMLIQVHEADHYGYGPLFQIDVSRFGPDPFGGIFWFDPVRENMNPSPHVGRQIFGHTPVSLPVIGDGWVNMNNQEYGFWVYDTEKDFQVNIGKNALTGEMY